MFIFFTVALAAKKGGSIGSKTLIIIIVTVLVALIFLCCSIYYLWRKYVTNKGDYHYIHILKAFICGNKAKYKLNSFFGRWIDISEHPQIFSWLFSKRRTTECRPSNNPFNLDSTEH